MTRQHALWLGFATVLAAFIWAPDMLPAAAAVAALAGIVAVLAPPAQPKPTPATINRWPTAYERQHARWLPGVGMGFSLLHWPPRPFLFLSVFRWRR